jgi:hypothetical protein
MLIRIRKLAVIILVIAMVTPAVILVRKYEKQYKANQETFQRELKIEQDKHKREIEEQDKASQDKIEQQKIELESEIERLKQQSAAKKAQSLANAQKAAQNVATAVVPHAQAAPSGGKVDWLRASGIPESQWSYVDSIVTRESGWNPNAVNKNGGACGLGQQLPCGKWAGAWNDPVAALKAMNSYVTARYGSWAGAVAFWNANKWY